MDLVVLGCSQGGIDALGRLLPVLRPDSPPVIVTIYLPPQSETLLPSIFQERCHVQLKEAEDKEAVRPGFVYFAPPNYHLLVEPDETLSLSVEEPVNYSRPSIDLLFESASALGERTAGVLLSGANADGAQGLKRIRDEGGFCVVQDPRSAEAPVMPRAALDLLEPDLCGDLGRIADWLAGLSRGAPHG